MVYECNKKHIAITYGSQPCPLCASHESIREALNLLEQSGKKMWARDSDWDYQCVMFIAKHKSFDVEE